MSSHNLGEASSDAMVNNLRQNHPPNNTANVSPFSIFQDSNKSYADMTVIRNGTYGTVYKAKDISNNGQNVVLKKVCVSLGEDGVPFTTMREICLMKRLTAIEHPNIVRLLDICHGRILEHERQMLVYLVFEHIDQDLATYLEKSSCLTPDKIKDIMYQLLNGLDFLHFNLVVHTDLKPLNVLISNQGIVKLADFGLARIFTNTTTSVVVTWYRSPELLLSQAYDLAVDLWSCGCIMAELYTRKPLFPGDSDVDQLAKIFEIIGSPSQSKWPTEVSLPWTSFKLYKGVPLQKVLPAMCADGIDLLKRMLRFDSKERISCVDAKKHPYFQDFKMYPPPSLSEALLRRHQLRKKKVP